MSANAQQVYFNQRYHFSGQEVVWSVLELDSGYLCAVGAGASDEGLLLYFLDSAGNKLTEKFYSESGSSFYAGLSGSLIKTSDGGFALGGSMDMGLTSHPMLWRFDANGDTLWTKTYGSSAYDQIGYQCKQTPDGGFVIIGVTDKLGTNDILLIKTDSLGNLEWDTTYGGSGDESGFGVIVCNDNGYLLSGFTNSFGAGGNDAYIIKVNETGTVQWSQTYGDANDNGGFHISQTSDGGYICAGALFQFTLSTSFDQTKAYLMKIDSVGNIEWDKTYGPTRFASGGGEVHELPDGSFVTAGQSNNNKGTPNGNGWAIGFTLKVSSQGDSIWYREHEYDTCIKNDDFIRDMKPTSDGGFIVAGFFGPRSSSPCFDTGGQDMWVLKLDSCGCAYAGCDSACQQLVGVEELQDDVAKILIYPNPFSSQATVQFDKLTADAELMIYDVTGRLLRKYSILKNQNSVTLDGEEIGTGIFFVQLRQEHSVLASRKVIITE